ncbi:MAG TPA: hypothetical protein VFQ32_01165 [Ktedonobacterales bacterium]|nr:hypothetical protein [Ktedonobacterales bacterium]
MQDSSPDEAKARLGELIDAALRGERIVIARDDQQAVQLVPVTPPRHARKAGIAKGLIVIRDDFDEPLSEGMD